MFCVFYFFPFLNSEVTKWGDAHTPSGMAVQLAEHRVVAVLEDQVQLPFAPEHLDQIHQVGVFQLLQRHPAEEKTEEWSVRALLLSNRPKLLPDGHKHAVAPDNPSYLWAPGVRRAAHSPTHSMTN